MYHIFYSMIFFIIPNYKYFSIALTSSNLINLGQQIFMFSLPSCKHVKIKKVNNRNYLISLSCYILFMVLQVHFQLEWTSLAVYSFKCFVKYFHFSGFTFNHWPSLAFFIMKNRRNKRHVYRKILYLFFFFTEKKISVFIQF